MVEARLAKAARGAVADAFGTALAEKATDRFCLAVASPFPAIEGVYLEASFAGAPSAIVEFGPPVGQVSEAIESAASMPVAGTEALRTAAALRQARVAALREAFYRVIAPIQADIEVTTAALSGRRRRLSISPPPPTEVCWLNGCLRTPPDPRSLAEVAADARVKRIDVSRPLEPDIVGTPALIGIDRQATPALERGTGVVIAVVDTEVAARHPAFGERVILKHNYTDEPFGTPGVHGTAVAGIIAADAEEAVGVAPDATLYNYKVLASNRFLNGDDFDGAVAIQQAVEDGVHIVNCSWGAGPATDGTSREAVACDTAWFTGVVLVKSAGNRGPGPATLTTPADAAGVITVGATDRQGTRVEDYSSRGPTGAGVERPHLVAPGGSPTEGIISCLVGGGFGDCGHGTSYAAPHVTGLAALLLERDPTANPDSVRAALVGSATMLPGFDANTQGAGLVRLP